MLYQKKAKLVVSGRAANGDYFVYNEGKPEDKWTVEKDVFESTYVPADPEEVFMLDPDLENRFMYHPPLPGQPERYEKIRAAAKEFAYLLKKECPNSRDLSSALTELDRVVFHANASIARNEK